MECKCTFFGSPAGLTLLHRYSIPIVNDPFGPLYFLYMCLGKAAPAIIEPYDARFFGQAFLDSPCYTL
jgi:hypothetical protein